MLYALNPDGKLKWQWNTGENPGFLALAVDDDGTAYASAGNGKVYAVAADGHLLWSFIIKGFTVRGVPVDPQAAEGTPPIIDRNGTIYVTFADRSLYAVNPGGSLKWKLGQEDRSLDLPVVDTSLGAPLAMDAEGNIYTGTWIISPEP